MLLGGLIVVLLAASTATTRHAKDIEVLTTPSGPRVSFKSVDTKVYPKDESVTEFQHKIHPIKKAELSSLKKDSLSVKPVIKDEGTTGVLRKSATTGIAVPPQKHMNPDSGYDIVTSRKTKRDEGGLDFDEETPLSSRRLRPAATAQASRTSVKKGPNGQDYEYEYVYYYYDDDEDPEGGGGGGGSVAETTPAAKIEPAQITTSRARYTELERAAATGRGTRTEIPETRRPHVTYEEETVPTHIHRGRGRETQDQERRAPPVEEESIRRRPETPKEDKSRNRYTTIERGRGRPDANGLPTTLEPVSNEVLPSRGGHRTRGRVIEPVEDERLPANTRFPSRGRTQATTPPPTEPVPSSPKTRGGGSVRRPGVSLVDSSSFRTHSSDSAPDSDQGVAYTPHREAPTSLGPEDSYEVRPTTFSPPQTPGTHLPPELPPPLEDQAPPTANGDKAALDLYAILQQTQEENSVTQDEGPSGGNTELLTTELLTTTTTTATTTTTTTTTTTPEPTTTTTTTEPPAPSLPQAGRGRFRGSGGTRTRLRHHSTSTTTEASKEEEPPKRTKFSPSHSRNPSQVSAYGRRGSQRSTTSAPSAEVSSTTSPSRPRVNFAGGNRYRTRPRPGAAQPTEAPAVEEQPVRDEPAAPASTPAASAVAAPPGAGPLRPRLKVGGPRPLRPGPRINLKGRPGLGGLSTTAVPPTEPAPTEPPQDIVTTTPVSEEAEVGSKKRPLRIKPGAGGRPLPGDPTRRRPLPGRRISLPTPQPTASQR